MASVLKTKPREWSPRMWEGCDTATLLKLLASQRFAIDPKLSYIPLACSLTAYINTALGWAQRGIYGRKIDSTTITHPPLFVLGHWRTGTTLLHELLILDENHACPETHACLLPHHALLSERFFKRFLNFLMPGKRPMDNMALGWERPQEDEFALALLGLPSPYRDIAFPNRPSISKNTLDLQGLPEKELAKWKHGFMAFIRMLTFRDSRRLILKSPTHTARIPILLELFPKAKFINITRNPYVLFSSTVNLWTSMARKHGFQTPRKPDLIRSKVIREFRIIYERYLADRSLIPKGNLVEFRYESFVGNPVEQLASAYDQLGLPDWEHVRQRIEAYVANQKNYETNKYELSNHDRIMIKDEWGDLIAKLGYG